LALRAILWATKVKRRGNLITMLTSIRLGEKTRQMKILKVQQLVMEPSDPRMEFYNPPSGTTTSLKTLSNITGCNINRV
jgi:hypothetical protein